MIIICAYSKKLNSKEFPSFKLHLFKSNLDANNWVIEWNKYYKNAGLQSRIQNKWFSDSYSYWLIIKSINFTDEF